MKKNSIKIILVSILILTGCSKEDIPNSLIGRWSGDYQVIVLKDNGKFQFKHLIGEEEYTGNYTYNEIENTITLNVCTEKRKSYRTKEYCESFNEEYYTYYFDEEMLEQNGYQYKKTN